MFSLVSRSVVTAALIVGVAASAHADPKVYNCSGYIGKVVLTVAGRGFSVTGQVKWNDQVKNVVCTGTAARQTSTYIYGEANEGCPANYIRFDKAIFSAGEGKINFCNRSGGDTHDYSGYTYETFTCTPAN